MKLIGLSVLAGLLLVSANGASPPTPLTSGVLNQISLPAVSAPTLFSGTYSYTIKIPEGATRLEIDLTSVYDLDLYVRYGQPVDYGNEGQVLADYRSETAGGNETIVITGMPMKGGTY